MLRATTQKLQKSRQQLDRYESDLKSLQDQLASITQKVQEKQEAITTKRGEVEVFRKEAEQQERELLVARGEKPAAKMPNVVAEDLIGFDIDDELQQDPEAKRALEDFKASPHFTQIKQAMCKKAEGLWAKAAAEAVPFPSDHDDEDGDGLGSGKDEPMEVDSHQRAAGDKRGADKVALVALEKADVEQLYLKLHKDGQQPPDFTREQLQDAVTSVQNTKHRKTDEGSVRTGGSNG